MDLKRIYDYMTGRPETYKGLKDVGYDDFEKSMGDARYRRGVYNQLYINGGINSRYDVFEGSWQKTYGEPAAGAGETGVVNGDVEPVLDINSTRILGAEDFERYEAEQKPSSTMDTYDYEKMRVDPEKERQRLDAFRGELEEEGVNPESVYAAIDAGEKEIEKGWQEALQRRDDERREDSRVPVGPNFARVEGMYEDTPAARDLSNFSLAKDLYDDARNLLDASFKGSGFGRGVWDAVYDVDAWTAGLTELGKNVQLNRVYEKAKKGEELTASEARLLDAANYYTLAGALQQAYLPSTWYSVGQGLGGSIPYMLEFALTYGPASSVTKGLARAVFKKLGGGTVGRVGGEVIHGVTTGAVQTPLNATNVASGTYRRMMGNAEVATDENGVPVFIGMTDQKGFWQALGEATGAQYIENLSEVSGRMLSGAGHLIKRSAPRYVQEGLEKISDNRYVRAMADNAFTRGLRKVGKRFKIGNAPEEIYEEYFGGTINGLLIGDTDLESLYSMQSFVEITGTVAVTQVFLGAVGASMNHRSKRSLVKRYEKAEREYDALFSSPEERDMYVSYVNLNLNGVQGKGGKPMLTVLREAVEKMVNSHGDNFVRADGTFDTEAAKAYREEVSRVFGNYFVAKQLYDSYMAGIRTRKEADRERIATEMQEKAVNGQIMTVTLADGRRARVVSGDIVVDGDGRIDVGRSGDHFTAVYEDDGSTVQLPVEDSYTVEVVSVEDAVEAASRANDEMINREEEEAVYGPRPKLGETVTMLDSEGNRVQLVVSGEVDEMGNFMAVPMEDFDNNVKGMAVAVNMSQIVRDDAASEGVDGANEAAGASLQESGEGVAGEAETESTLSQKGNGESGELASEGDAMAEAIGRNRFGTIYQWTRGKFKEAAAFLRKKQGGYIKGVFHRDDIGDIDMIWGNDKAGLKHIIQKHIVEHDDFDSVAEAMETINRVIENGTESKQGTNISFDHEGYRVSIAQSGEGNWVLTAFDMTRGLGEKKRFKGDATIGDQNTSYMENGTLVSPQLESSESKGSEFEGEKQGESALSRIEKDAKGQPLYEKADVETAWDALVEQSEGDESIARDVAASMVKDKEAALKKMEKAPAKGATPAEKIADAKVRKENIDKARAELEHWQAIAGVPQTQAVGPSNPEINATNASMRAESALLSTEEKDEFGNPMVLAKDGTTVFGTIDSESGLTAAPIKLSLGENRVDGNGTNHGYGLLHIEAGHGEQIRKAGYKSVEDFVEVVAKNYTDIREGAVIGDNQTYLLEVSDEHNNTLFIQLSRDGSYWNINSAGIFKKKYSRRKPKVYSVPAVGESTNTDTPEVDSDQYEGVIAPAGNSSKTFSIKDNEFSEENQGKSDGNAVQSETTQVAGDVAESPVGRSLNAEEADMLISQMEQSAEVAPEMELTIENWDSEFGADGRVKTPIGEVKMGENQFTKLMRQGRSGKLGMVKPTLENPDIIIEDSSKAKDGEETERGSSYVYVKTFVKPDGSRYYYFTSVTVSKDGKEVVISNQEKRKSVLTNLLLKGKLVWKHADDVSTASDVADGLYSSQGNLSDPITEGTDAPQTNNSTSESRERIGEKQGKSEENAVISSEEDIDVTVGRVMEIPDAGDRSALVSGLLASAKAEEKSVSRVKNKVDPRNTQAFLAEQQRIRGEQDKARAEVAYWEEVKRIVEESNATESAPAEPSKVKAARPKSIRERISALGEVLNLRDYILRALATGEYKFIWGDNRNGTKGLGSHLGFGNNRRGIEERQRRIWLLNNEEGLYPEQVAERLYANIQAEYPYLAQDDVEVFNEMLDVLRYDSAKDMVSEAEDMRRRREEMYEEYDSDQAMYDATMQERDERVDAENEAYRRELESQESGTPAEGRAAEPLGDTVAAAEAEVNTNPTEKQKEAGNYRKGHVRIDGFNVTIENPKGSIRSGVDATGKEWSITMNNTYGYMRGTQGVDGDHIDVFLSDNPDNGNVYIVDQINQETGEFDEHKVMYGFNSMEEAKEAYLSNYSEGWKIGNVTEVSKEEFKKWVNSSHRKTKPFAEYSSINTISGESGDAVTDNLTPNTETTAIQGFDGYSQSEIKSIVQEYIQQKLDENDISANVVGIAVHGSRVRGNAKENSDLDVVVEYEGDIREDGMFNLLNDDDNGEALYIEGIRVDINPIRAQETGTLDKYMERSRKYDEEVLSNDSVEDSHGEGDVRYRKDEEKSGVGTDIQGNPVDENGTLFRYFTGSLSELISQARKSATNLIKKVIAPVSSRLRKDLNNQGLQIDDDYNHVIDNNAIRHTLKKHSGKNEEKRGQIPITETDFEYIADVVENYDAVEVVPSKTSAQRIIYRKAYSDGSVVYVEEQRVGRKELAAVTMWKKKSPNLTDANRFETTQISDLTEALVDKDSETSVTGQETAEKVDGEDTRYRRGEDGVQGVRRTQESEMEREVRGFGERMAERLGGGVRLVYSDEIADSEAHAEEKLRSKGYYDTATGEVVVVLDNNTVKGIPSVIEVAMTMMHEVVGHKGVRGLFGIKEDAFLDDVYRGMKARTKAEMESLYGGQLRRRAGESEEAFEARRRRLIADEYIAQIAERGNNPGLLRRVIAKIREVLRGLGVDLAMTDNDIRNILRRSARELTRRKDAAMNVREDGDVRYRLTEEEQGIVEEAKRDGSYMKAPNGEPTRLTEKQWAGVRTKAFKAWFGDWEKAARIEKLRKSEPVEISGEEYKGKYELNRDSAKQWLKENVRGEYVIADTGERIEVSGKGIEKVTSHSIGNKAHMQSLVAIPQLIENATFIEERPNEKANGKYDSYRYYVCGLKIGGVDYTVKVTIGVKQGKKYYDHALTEIEKGNLIEEIANGFTTTGDAPVPSSAVSKDTKLLSILQTNSLKDVDENGEPTIFEPTGEVDKSNGDEESGVLYRKVTDMDTLKRLEEEPTIKVYRAMANIDGKLYPPMSTKIDGKLRAPIELGVWEEAEERPDLVDEKGNFKLKKDNGTTVPARYNPYIHTSRTPLNDQFSSAYKRPNLVTVEVEVPVSELTSGYHAEKAKDSVGEKSWHAGPVSGKLPTGKKRKVILSRWDKPIRIVPDEEVAKKISEILDGENIPIPYNVITPSLRKELEKLGVLIKDVGRDDIRYRAAEADYASVQDDASGEYAEALSAPMDISVADMMPIEAAENAQAAGLLRDVVNRFPDTKIAITDLSRVYAAAEVAEIDGDRVRYRREVNERFNEELERQIAGELPKGHVYSLGRPSEVLLAAGIPDLPIELAASRLGLKASAEYESNHPFELREVMNLPEAIQHPIAVFDSKTRVGSKVILVELKDRNGNNFVVAMNTNVPKSRYSKASIQINDIRSIYPKDNVRDIVGWINRGDLLRYADKKKIEDWITQQRSNSAEVEIQNLDVAANIVKEFENPTIDGENVRYRRGISFDTRGASHRDTDITGRRERSFGEKASRLAGKAGISLYDEQLKLKQLQGKVAEWLTGSRKGALDDRLLFYEAENQAGSIAMDRKVRFDNEYRERLFALRAEVFKALGNKVDDKYYFYAKTLNERTGVIGEEAMAANKATMFSHLLSEQHPGHDFPEGFFDPKEYGYEALQAYARKEGWIDSIEGYIADCESRMGEKLVNDIWGVIGEIAEYQLTTSMKKGLITRDHFDRLMYGRPLAELVRENLEKGLITEGQYRAFLATDFTADELVKAGFITREQREGLKRRYEYYLPLKGDSEPTTEEVADYERSRSRVSWQIKSVKGGNTRLVNDPVSRLLADVYASISYQEKMAWIQSMYHALRLAERQGKGAGDFAILDNWVVKDETGDYVPYVRYVEGEPVFTPTEQEIAKGEVERARNLPIETAIRVPEAVQGEHIVKLKHRGRTIHIYFRDPAVANAVNNHFVPRNVPKLMKGLRAAGGFMGKVYTQWNIFFSVRNLSKDFGEAAINNYVQYGGRYMAEYMVNYWRVMRHAGTTLRGAKRSLVPRNDYERRVEEFFKYGGEVSYTQIESYDKAIRDFERELKRSADKRGVVSVTEAGFVKIGKAVSAANKLIELNARLATFITSRERGYGLRQSIRDAKEVTVNFDRRGRNSMEFGSLFLFWNAGRQSNRRKWELMRENPGRFWTSRAAMGLLNVAQTYVLGSALAAVFGVDWEDYMTGYYDIPDYIRYNNIVVMSADGKVYRIPLSPAFAPYKTLVENIGEATYRTAFNDRDGRYDWGKGMADIVKSVSADLGDLTTWEAEGGKRLIGWAPAPTVPLLEAMCNVDFTGRPVYKVGNSATPGYKRAYAGTKDVYVEITEWLNRVSGGEEAYGSWVGRRANPGAVQHVVEGYLGGLIQVLSKFWNVPEALKGASYERLPFVDTFYYGDAEMLGEREVRDDIYDARRLVESYNDVRSNFRKTDEDYENNPKTSQYLENNEYRIDELKDLLKKYDEVTEELKSEDSEAYRRELRLLRRSIVELTNEMEEY